MAPRKKSPNKSAKMPKAKKPTLPEEVTALAQFLPEEMAAEILTDIDFNTRILELNQQAESLQAELRELFQDHPNKEELVANEYYHLARRFTNALNELNVSALGAIAEDNDEWPIMVGPSKRSLKAKEQERFLKQLRLGKQMSRPPTIDLTQKTLYPADIAFLLTSIVHSFYAERLDDSNAGFCLAELREAKWPALQILAKKINGTLDWSQDDIARLKTALAKLEPLSKGTLNAWIDASLAVFVCVTNNKFEENTTHLFKQWIEEAKEQDKNKRGYIIDRLRDALRSAFRTPRNR
jgi:hypothetical protein